MNVILVGLLRRITLRLFRWFGNEFQTSVCVPQCLQPQQRHYISRALPLHQTQLNSTRLDSTFGSSSFIVIFLYGTVALWVNTYTYAIHFTCISKWDAWFWVFSTVLLLFTDFHSKYSSFNGCCIYAWQSAFKRFPLPNRIHWLLFMLALVKLFSGFRVTISKQFSNEKAVEIRCVTYFIRPVKEPMKCWTLVIKKEKHQ